jgi:hypothetical protein
MMALPENPIAPNMPMARPSAMGDAAAGAGFSADGFNAA